MMQISLTEIFAFRECPLRYHLFKTTPSHQIPLKMLGLAADCYLKTTHYFNSFLLKGEVPDRNRANAFFEQLWQTTDKDRILLEDEDYPEANIKQSVRKSLESFYSWIEGKKIWKMEAINLLTHVKFNYSQSESFSFRHRIHSIFVTKRSSRLILRQHFGLSIPDDCQDDPWAMTDALMFHLLHPDFDLEQLTYHALQKYVQVHNPCPEKLRKWKEELYALIHHIAHTVTFPAHPGKRCLLCPFFRSCPELHQSNNTQPLLKLLDIKNRLIAQYFDVLAELEVNRKMLLEIKKAILAVAKRENLAVFNNEKGQPVLHLEREIRLPVQGSAKYQKLMTLFSQAGVAADTVLADVEAWINAKDGDCLLKEKVMNCLRVRTRFIRDLKI